MKESRNRDNNTKKMEYIWNERCKFCKKVVSMTKKVVRNFGENRRELFQDFLSENKFAKNFCPPIFVTQIFAPLIFVTQIFAPQIFMTSLRRCTNLRYVGLLCHSSVWLNINRQPTFGSGSLIIGQV